MTSEDLARQRKPGFERQGLVTLLTKCAARPGDIAAGFVEHDLARIGEDHANGKVWHGPVAADD